MNKSIRRIAHRWLQAVDMTEAKPLTKDQQKKIHDLLKKHKGKDIPDKLVHDLADEMGVDTDDVESYIYGLAAEHVNMERTAAYMERDIEKTIRALDKVPIYDLWATASRLDDPREEALLDCLTLQRQLRNALDKISTDQDA